MPELPLNAPSSAGPTGTGSAASAGSLRTEAAPIQLVFDGGCPFCHRFAAMSERHGGQPRLQTLDGRADRELRRQLQRRGFDLADGAVLIEGERCWHGADAVSRLCSQLRPDAGLLALLTAVFASPARSQRLYPLLLGARRLALLLKGLPVDP